MRPRVALLATALLVLTGVRAAADPVPAPPNAPLTWYHVQTDGHLVTDGGTDLRLPPGYYLPEPAWRVLDGELRRLQDAETRLGAENKSLRGAARGWQPGWKTIAGALALGLVGGWYIHDKL